MILKIGNEYLKEDFNVTVEKKTKLFDDIASVQGDFSYSSTMNNTAETRRILGLKSVQDLNKLIFQKYESSFESNDGITIYRGYIRVESVDDSNISFSFFSGNTDWIESLSKINLREINWSAYDTDINDEIIVSRINNTSGIVFPLVNKGFLHERKSNFLFPEDYHPFMFFKDILVGISNASGIKIKGNLLVDGVFSQSVTSNAGISDSFFRDNSFIINKTSAQDYSATAVPVAIEFDSDTEPYYNTLYDNWNVSTHDYTPEFNGVYQFSINIRNTVRFYIYLYLNGSIVQYTQSTSFAYSFTYDPIEVTTSDTVDIRAVPVVTGIPGSLILENSNVSIEPINIYRVTVSNILPDWTATKFLSNVFRMFNVLPTYDSVSKTIYVNLFRDIPKSDEIDISEYLSEYKVDYVTIPSQYSKNNTLKYSQQSNEYVSKYEEINGEESYGSGIIRIDNDFLNEETDLFTLDFVAPIQLNVGSFGVSLPFLDFAEANYSSEIRTITSITDSGGFPQFNWSGGGSLPNNGEFILFRIENASNELYNGDYVGSSGSSTNVIPFNADYLTNATATLTVINVFPKKNNDQVVLIYKPGRDYSEFSGINFSIYKNYNSPVTPIALLSNSLGYFYFPKKELTNKSIYRHALYFDRVNDEYADQVGLKEYCYKEIENILNDPAQVIGIFFLPQTVFSQIDFTRKVRLKTKDFNACFFVENITGYKESSIPCEIKLIKL